MEFSFPERVNGHSKVSLYGLSDVAGKMPTVLPWKDWDAKWTLSPPSLIGPVFTEYYGVDRDTRNASRSFRPEGEPTHQLCTSIQSKPSFPMEIA